jgi:Tfp pilus assembly protein PilO
MTARERNLLILLVAIAFIVANFMAYRVWYQPRLAEMEQDMRTAQREASFNEVEVASLDQIANDQAWLVKNEPEPATVGAMQTRIQQLASNEALRAGLTVKRQDFGDPVIDPSLNYHRARIRIEVNGREEAIYRWLDRLHRPGEFRAVTFVRLSPQRNDATKADAEVFLDQWFVPKGGQV